MNKIDAKNPMPRYFQLKEILLRYIENEGLRKNDKIPSIRTLIDKYSVSLPVVTRALKELEKDNVIGIKKARGCFVKNLPANLIANNKILFLLYGRDFSDPYYSKVLTGIEQESTGENLTVMYKYVESGKHLTTAINSDLAGIILAGDMEFKNFNEVNAKKIPIVLISDLYEQQTAPETITSIVNDDRQGAYTAVKYLLELGHRKIGLITGPREIYVWNKRYRGYRDALGQYGLPVEKRYMAEAGEEKDIRSGYMAMKQIMSRKNHPTAVFTGNDWYALGAYFFLGENGIKIGKDISIIGFDDLSFSVTLMPPLTTIAANMEEIGRRAVKALLEKIKNHDMESRREIISVKLIERKSCCKYENI
ncbi:MAG: GntR family transcriptional regulator [Victivallales bacterium]|nr:GntR family transcriptional regulator [Victivallales bacterium]